MPLRSGATRVTSEPPHLMARGPLTSVMPLTGSGAGFADRPQRPGRVRGQRADQPGDHRIGGHRPGQLRLGAQHCDIGQAVPAQRQHHHQVGEGFSPGHAPPAAPATGPGPPPGPGGGPVTRAASASSKAPPWETSPTVSGHDDLGAARGILHGISAFGSARTGPSTSPILPGQRHFLYANDQDQPATRESPRLTVGAPHGAVIGDMRDVLTWTAVVLGGAVAGGLTMGVLKGAGGLLGGCCVRVGRMRRRRCRPGRPVRRRR